MRPGDALKLVREPKNKFDTDAIALYYREQKIGFVPAEKNEVISRLLDNNSATLRAAIIEIDKNNDARSPAFASIYLMNEP